MRLRRSVTAVLATVLVASASGVAVSWADEPVPTPDEVEAAERAAEEKARDVATVQAELARANADLEASAVAAAQAAEAYNGALHELDQARAAARRARTAARAAADDVRRQQREYGAALVRSYQSSPEIAGVAAVLQAHGVQAFVEQRVTMDNAVGAMESRYDRFRASATVAELSSTRASDAADEAADLEREARTLRDAAASASRDALAQAEAIAERKSELVAELAELQGVSVALAERRQKALEERAAEEAAEARRQEQERQEEERQPAPAPEQGPAPDRTPAPRPQPAPEQSPAPRPDRTPTPAPQPPAPRPTPTPAPAPAPSGGASAAVAFATAQLGEPYVWGAAGPNAWDCSGLTMKAWQAGGKSLPHWSVGQYRATTPISASSLRAGDLVFWSSSSNPDSIFHVALYVGDGMIVHAPRTGRPVVKESMYYWRTPNFFTRP